MPVEFEDQFQRQKEGEAVVENILRVAQPLFEHCLSSKSIVSDNHIWCWISEPTPKKHFLGRVRKRTVAEIFYGHRGNARVDITVYDPAHKEAAMALAAMFSLVYTDNIRVTVERPNQTS